MGRLKRPYVPGRDVPRPALPVLLPPLETKQSLGTNSQFKIHRTACTHAEHTPRTHARTGGAAYVHARRKDPSEARRLLSYSGAI